MSDVFYITTPIYYVSGVPHLGSAYTTIACDTLARYHRLRGEEVVFATGTDEHGNKSVLEAAKAGIPTAQYVDQMVAAYKETWERLHIRYDRFIRTSEDEHTRVVQDVFSRLLASDDIYLGEYEGWYCVPCETYLLEADIVGGNCPDCGREVKRVAEPAYFLRTSKYADRLLHYIEDNEHFIMPDGACKEVLGFIKQGLQDACISRARTDWDIPVPGDDTQSIYVWFDALINYLTVAGFGVDDAKFARVWPPVQLMGKDILPRFHATIWTAMLLGLGVELPEMLFAHGWWLADSGDKMSKSRGNVVLPYETAVELAEQSGARTAVAVDALRYFVLREVPFGLDGSFSFRALVGRFNADLANDLGNLLNRSLPLVERYLEGVVPTPGPGAGNLAASVERTRGAVEQALALADFRGALEAVWELLGEGNKFLHEREPWTLHKDGKQVELEAVLYDALDCVRIAAILIAPFMPEVAEEICRQLGLDAATALRWDLVEAGHLAPGTKIERDNPIFPRVDMDRLEQKLQSREQQDTAAAPPAPEQPMVSFDHFKQMELRVGQVLEAERVPGADKLLQLKVDIGETEPRQIVAGIALEFNPRELLDRKVIVIANLEPAKIRGVESRGMLLAAGEEKALGLLTVDADVPVGTKVR